MSQPHDTADRIEQAWRRERPDLDPSSIGVVTRIWHLAKELGDRRRRLLAERGIDAAQMDLLGALRRSGDPWTLTTRDLAAATQVTPGAISQRVARAEERRWVTRRHGPARTVEVTLTPAGRALVDDVAADIFAADDDLLAPLTDRQRAQLASTLRLLTTGSAPDRPLPHVGQPD